MKRYIVYFGIALISILHGVNLFADEDGKVRTVVIDAGHGGKDPGASGKNSVEKDIALSIALKTGGYIEEYLPDVEVIYTRKTDKFVELHKRAQIANEAQADLFISIHCNANRSSRPYGAETYVMGLHKTEENLAVAQKENAAILKEEDYQKEYEGFNPESTEAYIIFSLFQNEFLNQSVEFASLLQNQFRERVGLRDRSVKQAGFLVLYHITMPGVLVETGFLSNSKDERFLMSKKGQVYIASAIFRAFRDYKKKMEKEAPEEVVAAALEVEAKKISQPEIPEKTPEKQDNENMVEKSPGVIFSVQFATSEEQVPFDASRFKEVDDISVYHQDGLFKYISGEFSSFRQANSAKNHIRNKGFSDAFVVAFQNNERISLQEAKKLSKN